MLWILPPETLYHEFLPELLESKPKNGLRKKYQRPLVNKDSTETNNNEQKFTVFNSNEQKHAWILIFLTSYTHHWISIFEQKQMPKQNKMEWLNLLFRSCLDLKIRWQSQPQQVFNSLE